MSVEQGLTESPAQQQPSRDAAGENAGDAGGFELDEDGQRVSPGMGQSKSSRRRRRKRKNKGSDAGPGETESAANGSDTEGSQGNASSSETVVIQQGSDSTGDASASPSGNGGAAAPGTSRQNHGGGRTFAGNQPNQNGANGAPGGTKRWKKKFRDRERPRQGDNPGNQSSGGNGGPSQSGSQGGQSFAASGGGFRGPDTHQPGNGGGFKRKGSYGAGGKQQRSPRGGFVGPMDHSYRAVNGNFMETPPSTMEPHGNYNGGGGRSRGYQGDSQPIDYSQGRAVPIAEGAPTKIYFFIEDLFFTAKIQETARKLGVKVAFIKNDKESIASLTSGEEADRPGLIVFDLNNANAKPLTLIPKLKTKLKKSTSIIGFLSHLQGDLKAKAVDAGCDTVMPRAAFSQNLPNLLRRYGIEDVEEPNFNQ